MSGITFTEVIPCGTTAEITRTAKASWQGKQRLIQILICGAIRISVNECDGHTDFIVPTPEQRKNLKEMLCIDVKVFDEERSDNHDGE